MKLNQTFSLFLILFFFSMIMSLNACTKDKSDLPEELPGDIKITYTQSDGKSREKSLITVAKETLTIQETDLYGNEKTAEYNIDISEIENLYYSFRDNKFDNLKNIEPGDFVYDAGSEEITLSFDSYYYGVSGGPNSPFENETLQTAYDNIKSEILNLVSQYKK